MTAGEMRAVVVRGRERSALADEALPLLGADDVLARVEAVGVRGSDVELLAGTRPSKHLRYPTVPGHEWVGRVVAVGERVTNVRSGSAFFSEGIRGCGECARCLRGRSNLSLNGYAETGFAEPGALANSWITARWARSRSSCVPDRPTSVSRSLRTHGALESGPPEAALAPDNLGCKDSDLEASGSSDGAAPIRLARRGGTIGLAGIAETALMSIAGDWISTGSRKVQGVFGSVQRARRWLAGPWNAGELDFTALVTHRLPLSGTLEAFELATDPFRGALKVLVLPNSYEER
ncbi:MAG TPA: alcohol dehydrogenase catalytic domain-containing protein [Acidimicrobiales bacterium]